MDFVSIRVITEDTRKLVAFYEEITGVTARWYTDDFAEIATPSCTLAIAHARTAQLFAHDAARAAANHSVILEFRVGDVDAEYQRIAPVIGPAVQEPTTMPWGNRSLLFRDPDGNLVNYFTPVRADAVARADRPR